MKVIKPQLHKHFIKKIQKASQQLTLNLLVNTFTYASTSHNVSGIISIKLTFADCININKKL